MIRHANVFFSFKIKSDVLTDHYGSRLCIEFGLKKETFGKQKCTKMRSKLSEIYDNNL